MLFKKLLIPSTKLALFALILLIIIPVKEKTASQTLPTPSLISQSNLDSMRTEAERLFDEGMELYQQGTPESLKKAIEKWEQGLVLYQKISNKSQEDISWEVKTLTAIGESYYFLGEQEKALLNLHQALPLSQSVDNRSFETVILTDLSAVYNALGDKQKALDYSQQSLSLSRKVGNRTEEATTLNNIGAIYKDLGDKQKALDYYQQSLPLRKAVGDQTGEAITLKNIGDLYKALGELQKALDYLQQALPLSRAVGDRTTEASTLNNIGGVYGDLGDKQKALDYYQQALLLSRTIGNRAGEAIILNNIGNVYKDLEEKQKALDYYSQSLLISKELGNRSQSATNLNDIGNIYDDLGEKQKALDYYSQSLLISKELGDRLQEAINLNDIGSIYNTLGEQDKALDYLNQALSIDRELNETKREATTLNNIGYNYAFFGDKQKALAYYQQALSIRKKVDDRLGEATTLNNIGHLYDSLGDKQKALNYYNQSLLISKELGDRTGEATTLNNMGVVYNAIGEKQKALDLFNQVLYILQQVGNRFQEATTLNNIGAIYDDLGEKQKALNYYNQSLSISKEFGDRSNEANALNNIGYVYNALGEKQKALDYFQQALPISKAVGDRAGEATNLNNIAGIYDSLGDKQKALDYVNQALVIQREIGDRSGEARTLYNIAYTEKTLGNLQNALTNIKSSIEIIEDLRTKIDRQDLRQTYFATVQDYYKFYIELLMEIHRQKPDTGYNIMAFEVSEQARARSLLDLLNEANADIRKDVDPQLKEREQQLLIKLRGKTQYQLQLIHGNYSQEQLEIVKKEIDDLNNKLQQVKIEIRTKNPRYAELTQPQTVKLKDIQQQLDQDSILLSYSLGEKESYLWVITPNSLTSYTLAKKSEIETLADEFYLLIADDSKINSARKTRAKKAIELTNKLLATAQSQLTNKRLVIVADGGLQYIPFNSLATFNSTPESFKPLIFDHEIINLPSASVISAIRQNQAQHSPKSKTLAVIADPVFSSDDPRITNNKSPQNKPNQDNSLRSLTLERLTISFGNRDSKLVFQRLEGTRKEAENILKLVPNSESKKYLDFEANLTAINDPELSKYRFILLATHGFLNGINPELSGIVLSLVNEKGEQQEGLLMTPDIFNLNLPAELIVLSACESGLGKDVKGEGIVGLTRGFMYAGTSRLMVSLWKVNDQSTAELMTRFYQGILQEKLTPAQALRKAQLSMWEEGNAPYYWSAFILQGEWR